MSFYVSQIFLTLSTLLNALTGGRWPETMSYRSAKAQRDGKTWGCILCRLLDLFDRRHCRKTIAWWERSSRN